MWPEKHGLEARATSLPYYGILIQTKSGAAPVTPPPSHRCSSPFIGAPPPPLMPLHAVKQQRADGPFGPSARMFQTGSPAYRESKFRCQGVALSEAIWRSASICTLFW